MIYILLGLPRSGKSSIVNSLLKPYYNKENSYCFYNMTKDYPKKIKVLSNRMPFSVICADDIRLALTGQRYYEPAEPIVHSIKQTMIRSMLLKNQNILIDETHSSDRSIRELLALTPDVYGHFVNTSPEVCEQRAIACGQNDLVDKGVIRNMAENFRNMHPNFRMMFDIKATWI